MTRKSARIIGMVLLAAAAGFVVFALGHPERSFPWSNAVTYLLYGVYFTISVLLLIAPFGKKRDR